MTAQLESKRQAWDALFNEEESSASSLRQRALAGPVCQTTLRSVCWKVFLGYYPSLDFATWSAIQTKKRDHYANLRKEFIDEPAKRMKEGAESDLLDNNPLSLNDNNPWQQHFADSETRKTIRQDVERTFPDVDFFRADQVQEHLTDVLFIYCKLNQDVSYRQGMHELLAPLYWVLANDSVEAEISGTGPLDASNKLLVQVLDPAYIEHDAFILFERLMTYAKPWYEFNENSRGRVPGSNPVVVSCQRIHHQYLRAVDPVLYGHLEKFGIEPQLYGMRWLRLLFGREFEFHELLMLWDAMFAHDPTLKIVEYISLAILLRLRDKLMAGDYAECLSLLMRCPHVGKPATLVEQAKYLSSDLSESGGLHVLQQNDLRAGKAPRHSLWDGVERQEPRPSPSKRLSRQHSNANLENLANLTRGVMKSPQVRDLNKAIAGVMGTVQKNVNLFGDNMLARAAAYENNTTNHRRLTVSSEFPASIDTYTRSLSRPDVQQPQSHRIIPTTTQPNQSPTVDSSTLNRLKATNNQMGELMAKCIDVMEKEIFTEKPESEELQEQRKTFDEAAVVAALVGLKHVRDVLSGKQVYFDSSVLDTCSKNEAEGRRSASLNDWDVVDYEADTKPEDGPATFAAASTVKESNTDAKAPLADTKPALDPAVEHRQSAESEFAAGKPRSMPKQNVVYRIEDLLADPALQSPSASNNQERFRWMLNDKEDKENDGLFKSQPSSRTMPRKRESFSRPKITSPPLSSSGATIDPLDAQNIDKRKAYEYDTYL
ncbi:rab-GTPase-TBC domain-domain-containing protein [Syncephalastrum racemosum]|uniref:Rab-GTPase-TBC domain-domain-containing protein n=1 Tax=Syncephalastrum racemosum TaxID=13706 RepID=A0A1X2HNJ2_SYNRA|nr:rab-GTPase-TBC domain-domain-containing protein [Syncephalastrum racemosum]